MAAVRRATKANELYYVASTARTKLGKEACRESHRLRMLVGHANTLDCECAFSAVSGENDG